MDAELVEAPAFRCLFDPSPTLRQAQGAAQDAGSMVYNTISNRVLPVIGLSMCDWRQSGQLNLCETRLTGTRCLVSVNNALFING